jgi:DNA polymerase-3 subunit delta'
MAFLDIAGNTRIKKILKLALQRGRVPGAVLFCGPEGVGKRETARTLAKALNCLRLSDDSCDDCESCRKIDSRTMPDVIEVSPDGDSIGIDEMRMLRPFAYMKPMTGRKRVFLFDEVEKMTDDAANSFLKTLEEPPPFTHIFLVSDNPSLVLPTVKSRCQTLNFLPVAKEDIELALERQGIEKDKAGILALLVHGNLEEAKTLDWDEVREKRKEAWALFRAMAVREDDVAFLRTYAFQRRKDIEKSLERTLDLFYSFCRDVVLLKEGGDPLLLFNPDYERELRETASSLGLEQALIGLESIENSLSALDRNLNVNLIATSLYARITG